MVLWALILCGLLGAISNPEGLGLVSICGQYLGQVLLPAVLQQGKAGQDKICYTAMFMLRNSFISRDWKPENLYRPSK